MKSIIILANCVTNAGGDFSIATRDIAYTIVKFNMTIASNETTIMITSDSKGLSILTSMYPQCETSLKVYDLTIPIVSIPDIEKQNIQVDYLLLVGCKLPSAEDIKGIVSPASTIIRVGLPHYTQRNNNANYINLRLTYGKLTNNFDYLALGIGKNKCGVKIPPELLVSSNHYYNLTNASYGFAYVQKTSGENSDQQFYFLVNYVVTALKVKFPINNFIFIDKGNLAVDCAQMLTFKLKRPIRLLDTICGTSVTFTYTQIINDEPPKVTPLTDVNCLDDTINILSLTTIPQTEMQLLMKNAIRFVGVTGVSSLAEASTLGKISLIQYQTLNAPFISDWQSSLKNELPNEGVKLERLFHLTTWKNKLNKTNIQEIVGLLDDANFCSRLIKANMQLFKEKDKVLPTLCQKLNLSNPN